MKINIRQGLNANKNIFDLREEIVKFKINGGSQKEAEEILYELRKECMDDEVKENKILDLLDFVVAWCQEKNKIWNENWSTLAEEYDNKDWSFSCAYVWKKIIERHPTNFNLIQYSDQLRLSGNYLKAQETIEKVSVEKIPDESKFLFYVQQGVIYKDQGQLDNAIHSFRESIKLAPQVTYPYVFLATSLSEKSELEEAQCVLEKALNKEGDVDEVNYNLSLIFARKGNFKKAIVLMEDCLNMDPKYPNAQIWIEDFKNMVRNTG